MSAITYQEAKRKDNAETQSSLRSAKIAEKDGEDPRPTLKKRGWGTRQKAQRMGHRQIFGWSALDRWRTASEGGPYKKRQRVEVAEDEKGCEPWMVRRR